MYLRLPTRSFGQPPCAFSCPTGFDRRSMLFKSMQMTYTYQEMLEAMCVCLFTVQLNHIYPQADPGGGGAPGAPPIKAADFLCHKRLFFNHTKQIRNAYWAYIESVFFSDTQGPGHKKMFYNFVKHTKSENIGIAPLNSEG